MTRTLAFLLCLWLPIGGCSATQATTRAAQKVNVVFDTVDHRADDIIAEVDSGDPDPKAIRGSAVDIKTITQTGRKQTGEIFRQIPKMEDKVPLWLKVVYLAAILGCLTLVWLLLERTGLMLVIKKFLWGLGWLIPEPARAEAKLLQKAEQGEIPPAEVTQYFRTRYPDINAAIKRREDKESEAISTLGSRLNLLPSSADSQLESPDSDSSGPGSSDGSPSSRVGFCGPGESKT